MGRTTKLSPKQVFVVSQVTRAQIAENLNDHLQEDRFKPDDKRLTDKICKAYVAGLSKVDNQLYDNSSADDLVEQVHDAILDQILFSKLKRVHKRKDA